MNLGVSLLLDIVSKLPEIYLLSSFCKFMYFRVGSVTHSMDYIHKLIPKTAQKTSTWSGGTTTELAIFPEGSSYAARNFQWRLSTALVTAAESTFTALPGWHRLLMVLNGSMQLTHAGHHQVTLRPFEQDAFSGNWITHCAGMGQDFNLMLAAGWQGRLQALSLADGERTGAMAATGAGTVTDGATEAFYCYVGAAQVNEITMNTGDFLLLEPVEMLGSAEVPKPAKASQPLVVRIAACHGPAKLIRATINRIESDPRLNKYGDKGTKTASARG
ncbi:MAG TPA: hypothetical protein DDZ65_08060 [Firmicutes bacterium]|nr:hypothetical protein [Bacillota bacterium]